MDKNKITSWGAIVVGIFLIGLTSLNLYLGRTNFVEQGWIHLGLGILSLSWGVKNSKKVKK